MIKKIFVFFFFLFFPFLSFAQNISSIKHVLDNGMTVILSEMPSSPVVSVYGFVNSGSATEYEFLGSGISHLVEHMVFKGTEERKAGEIPALIQSLGGTINASTNKDYTVYTITVPHEHFDVALEVLSDMLTRAAFDPQEFKKEKEVIVNEIRMHWDNPDRRLNEMVFNQVYLNHPYRHPIIGYESLFVKLTREDALKYYKKAYVPHNIVISVAGQVNGQEVIEKVEKAFNGFDRQVDNPRNLPVEPQQITSRHYQEQYPTDLARLTVAFQGINVLHEDLFALDVLASILGDGQSSRLYQALYNQKKLVYSISAYNYTPLDKGFLAITALLDEQKIEQANKAIWEEIKRIKQGITKEELEKVKKNILAQYILDQQTTSSVTFLQAINEAFAGDYLFWQKYIKGMEDLKPQDIKRVAQKYLNENSSTTVVLIPKKEKENKVLEEIETTTEDIQKVVLDNGIVVLLREEHTFPIASMNLIMPGGVSEEPEELNGLANIIAGLLTKGTKSKNAQQIAALIDSLGLRLSASSGRNNFAMRLECLAQDFLPALELFEDIFKNPVFPIEEFNKEKERVKASIKAKEDSIFQATNRELKQLLFLSHPARLEPEGSLDSVERITREDVVSFYPQFMDSGKMVISVFGDINPPEILSQIKKRFGSLKKKDITIDRFKESPPDIKRQKDFFMNKQQGMLALAFQGPDMFSPDRYGVEVLTAILGSSFDSRMFRHIREKLGKAYSLGGSYSAGFDMGIIHFYILTTPEDLDKVQSLLADEINDLKAHEVSSGELEKTKQYLKGRALLKLETNVAIASRTSADEFFGLGFLDYKNYNAAIDKITAEDIKRLALEYLDFNKSALILTRPMPKE